VCVLLENIIFLLFDFQPSSSSSSSFDEEHENGLSYEDLLTSCNSITELWSGLEVTHGSCVNITPLDHIDGVGRN